MAIFQNFTAYKSIINTHTYKENQQGIHMKKIHAPKCTSAIHDGQGKMDLAQHLSLHWF
jgi:hypothetical protein